MTYLKILLLLVATNAIAEPQWWWQKITDRHNRQVQAGNTTYKSNQTGTATINQSHSSQPASVLLGNGSGGSPTLGLNNPASRFFWAQIVTDAGYVVPSASKAVAQITFGNNMADLKGSVKIRFPSSITPISDVKCASAGCSGESGTSASINISKGGSSSFVVPIRTSAIADIQTLYLDYTGDDGTTATAVLSLPLQTVNSDAGQIILTPKITVREGGQLALARYLFTVPYGGTYNSTRVSANTRIEAKASSGLSLTAETAISIPGGQAQVIGPATPGGDIQIVSEIPPSYPSSHPKSVLSLSVPAHTPSLIAVPIHVDTSSWVEPSVLFLSQYGTNTQGNLTVHRSVAMAVNNQPLPYLFKWNTATMGTPRDKEGLGVSGVPTGTTVLPTALSTAIFSPLGNVTNAPGLQMVLKDQNNTSLFSNSSVVVPEKGKFTVNITLTSLTTDTLGLSGVLKAQTFPLDTDVAYGGTGAGPNIFAVTKTAGTGTYDAATGKVVLQPKQTITLAVEFYGVTYGSALQYVFTMEGATAAINSTLYSNFLVGTFAVKTGTSTGTAPAGFDGGATLLKYQKEYPAGSPFTVWATVGGYGNTAVFKPSSSCGVISAINCIQGVAATCDTSGGMLRVAPTNAAIAGYAHFKVTVTPNTTGICSVSLDSAHTDFGYRDAMAGNNSSTLSVFIE